MDDQITYSARGIRRALESWYSLRAAAAESPEALAVMVDIERAMLHLPLALRQRLWHLLVMDGQHRLAPVYVHDIVRGPIRRMVRFLSGRV